MPSSNPPRFRWKKKTRPCSGRRERLRFNRARHPSGALACSRGMRGSRRRTNSAPCAMSCTTCGNGCSRRSRVWPMPGRSLRWANSSSRSAFPPRGRVSSERRRSICAARSPPFSARGCRWQPIRCRPAASTPWWGPPAPARPRPSPSSLRVWCCATALRRWR
ncbi:hypothetical protein GALL_532340 [mine drainage metagenome]|uniref:Uncharacterized protein n=1 Tax=mine drainage metagenome TaxID=410659 RepID=A0A1J5P2C2_9ZZZZ